MDQSAEVDDPGPGDMVRAAADEVVRELARTPWVHPLVRRARAVEPGWKVDLLIGMIESLGIAVWPMGRRRLGYNYRLRSQLSGSDRHVKPPCSADSSRGMSQA